MMAKIVKPVLLAVCAWILWASLSATPLFAQASFPQLVSSKNPSAYGTPVTFTATFPRRPEASIVPVKFFDGAEQIGNGIPTIENNTIVATFTTDKLAEGKHDIKAFFDLYDVALDQVIVRVPEVPEADTLLLLGGGIGGMATWLRFQIRRRKNSPSSRNDQTTRRQ